MYKLLKIIVFIVCILGNIYLIFGQDDAGDAAEFLRWGVGGSALGMGRAYTAFANDASSCYWNPAGLANSSKFSVSTTFIPLYEGADFTFIASSFSFTRWISFGIGYVGLSSGKIKNWEEINGDFTEIGSFEINKSAFLFSWAIRLKQLPSIDLGATLKRLQTSVPGYEEVPASYAGDIGCRFRSEFFGIGEKYIFFPHFIAVTFQNLTKMSLGQDHIPWSMKLGLGYIYNLNSDLRLFSALDFEKVAKRKEKLFFHTKIGFDIEYKQSLSLRVGVSWPEITIGIGFLDFNKIHLKGICFDYARSVHLTECKQLGYTNRYAFSYKSEQYDFGIWYQNALKTWNNEKARSWLIKILNGGGTIATLAAAYARLGDIEYQKPDYLAAHKYYKKAYDIVDKIRATTLEDSIWINKALCETDTIKFVSLFCYLDCNINLASKNSDINYLKIASETFNDSNISMSFINKKNESHYQLYKLLIEYHQLILSQHQQNKPKWNIFEILKKNYENYIKKFDEDLFTHVAHFYYALGLKQMANIDSSLYKNAIDTLYLGINSYRGNLPHNWLKFLGITDNCILDDIQYTIAECYLKMNKKEEAILALRNLIFKYPELDKYNEAQNRLRELWNE